MSWKNTYLLQYFNTMICRYGIVLNTLYWKSINTFEICNFEYSLMNNVNEWVSNWRIYCQINGLQEEEMGKEGREGLLLQESLMHTLSGWTG